MIGFLIGYAAVGFVLAGAGIAAVAFGNGRVSLSGIALIMIFWPFVLIAMISAGIKATRK